MELTFGIMQHIIGKLLKSTFQIYILSYAENHSFSKYRVLSYSHFRGKTRGTHFSIKNSKNSNSKLALTTYTK